MSELHSIAADGYVPLQQPFAPGPAPMQDWIAIDRLRIDPSYQRKVSHGGRKTVRMIAESFDWSRFAPVIVAPIEGGAFAVIDGQHRCTAALLRGIERVPCHIVQADRAAQAKAFAAVNGTVTAVTSTQIHRARLAAGEETAVAIDEACKAAGVRILMYPPSMARWRRGETMAVKAIEACLKLHGRDLLVLSLQCIVEVGAGNPGYVRSDIIRALCDILARSPEWVRQSGLLLDHMEDFGFADAYAAAVAASRTSADTVFSGFRTRLETFLTSRFESAEAA